MTKRFTIAVLLLACLSFTGCKKDAEINSIIADLDSFTAELVKKIESAPNPSAGVDDAQKFMDSKKSELTTKMTTLKGFRGYQVSDDTKKKMESSIKDDVTKVVGLQLKYATTPWMRDPKFRARLDKLTKDYTSLFTL